MSVCSTTSVAAESFCLWSSRSVYMVDLDRVFSGALRKQSRNLLVRPFLHSAQFWQFLPGQGLLAGAVSALRFGKSTSRQFGPESSPLPKCQSRRILPALEGSSGTHRTPRLPSVLSTWICSVLLLRSVSGQSTHSRRSWLLRGSCVRQGACWKCVALRGQGNAALGSLNCIILFL